SALTGEGAVPRSPRPEGRGRIEAAGVDATTKRVTRWVLHGPRAVAALKGGVGPQLQGRREEVLHGPRAVAALKYEASVGSRNTGLGSPRPEGRGRIEGSSGLR